MTDKTPDISAILFTQECLLRCSLAAIAVLAIDASPEVRSMAARAVRQTSASVQSSLPPQLARECAQSIAEKVAELFEGEVEPIPTAH